MITPDFSSYLKIVKNRLKLCIVLARSVIFLILFLSFLFKAYSQGAYLINTNAANIHAKASAKSEVIGKVNYGDTVLSNFTKDNWLNVSLHNGQIGFILKKFTSPVIENVPTKNISEPLRIDMSSWSFSSLFSSTFKYFLLTSLIILLVLLLIYYLK